MWNNMRKELLSDCSQIKYYLEVVGCDWQVVIADQAFESSVIRNCFRLHLSDSRHETFDERRRCSVGGLKIVKKSILVFETFISDDSEPFGFGNAVPGKPPKPARKKTEEETIKIGSSRRCAGLQKNVSCHVPNGDHVEARR